MTPPRRWTITGSSFMRIVEGPDIAHGEVVEVIEALPGVIVDLLGEDIRGEDAPGFTSFRPNPGDQPEPSPRSSFRQAFTPSFGDARKEDTPSFFTVPRPDGIQDILNPYTPYTWKSVGRSRTLRLGRWTITIQRRNR